MSWLRQESNLLPQARGATTLTKELASQVQVLASRREGDLPVLLKLPKHEIFNRSFYHYSKLYGWDIPWSKGIYKPILSCLNKKVSKILVCWAYAYNLTCTLSIHLWIVCVCSVYAYELYADAEHTLKHTHSHIWIFFISSKLSTA